MAGSMKVCNEKGCYPCGQVTAPRLGVMFIRSKGLAVVRAIVMNHVLGAEAQKQPRHPVCVDH